MPLILPVRDIFPVFGADCFLADNCTIVGDVKLGDRCSVWFNAVIRGDVNSIVIGEQVNIQDGAILHGTYERAATKVGNFVSIGHRAMVHGCTLDDYVLVGMGAIIMDHCHVETGSIIAAGAVLTENTHVPAGSVFAGVPAKKIKEVDSRLMEQEIKRIANNYLKYSGWFKTK